MIRRVLFFVSILLTTLAAHAAPLTPIDLAEARSLVEQFQAVPAEHMFCSARSERGFRWERGGDSERVLPELSRYFSSEMQRLFAWALCDIPKLPEPTMAERSFNWDFRYGLSETESTSQPSRAENVKILTPHGQKDSKIIVRVLFNFYLTENTSLQTTYTLIKENGQWKIDDIALKGYQTEEEEILPGSKSLKTELQAAYKRAEAKCGREPACKAKLGK